MPESIFLWATLGGFISFLAATLGSLLSFTHNRAQTFARFKFTIDFALGLMLSAVAFSLVGPAAKSFVHQPLLLSLSLLGFLAGSLCIFGLKIVIENHQKPSFKSSSELL